ncbi:MAG: hypothetical protein WB676_22375 [Bryobacteraceae bacterium]
MPTEPMSNSVRPPPDILSMRTYWRLQAEHARGTSRVQKALTQMNVRLANA